MKNLHIETWISTECQQEIHHFIKKGREIGKTYVFGINPQYVKTEAYKKIRTIVEEELKKKS